MSYIQRYILVIVIVFLTFAVAITGTTRTNSLGLLSEGLHLLADQVPLFLGLIATRKKAAGKDTSQSENRTSYANVLLLPVVGIWISIEAYFRLQHPEPVTNTMIYYAIGNSIGQGLQVYFGKGLKGAHNHSHTFVGQYVHLVLDWLASVGVILGALYLKWYGDPSADAYASYAVAVASFGVAIFIYFFEMQHHHKH
jgi:cobalt-zinc-cadmium efflux system protein